MRIFIQFGPPLLILLILTFLTSACFELGGSDEGLPCGDQLACPKPKQCIDQVCVSQCLNDSECNDGQVCESLRCVPRYQEEAQGGDNSMSVDQDGGQLNQED